MSQHKSAEDQKFLDLLAGSDGHKWPDFLDGSLKDHITSECETVIFDGAAIFNDSWFGPRLSEWQLIFDMPHRPDSRSRVARFFSVTVGYSEGYQVNCFRTRKEALNSDGNLKKAIGLLAAERE